MLLLMSRDNSVGYGVRAVRLYNEMLQSKDLTSPHTAVLEDLFKQAKTRLERARATTRVASTLKSIRSCKLKSQLKVSPAVDFLLVPAV